MTRRRRPWVWLAAALGTPFTVMLLVIVLVIAGVASLGRFQVLRMSSTARQASSCSQSATPTVNAAAVAAQVRSALGGSTSKAGADVPGLDKPKEQIPNAKIIQQEGEALRVPARGQVIALATALQESRLRNLSGGDRDSIGLFQQRPSQGWGTPQQIRDPHHAARSFYEHLLRVRDWERKPLTRAAQAVQRSGYPDAYAKWEPLATALRQALSTTAAGEEKDGINPALREYFGSHACEDADAGDVGRIPPGSLPDNYRVPATAPAAVRTALNWALGQLGTPYFWGGDCTDPHGTTPRGRCDCSSLVQRAYGVAGITLPRVTQDQVHEGHGVSVDHLRPGDLLFTEGSPDAPGHVGMYMGQGLIVHAPKTGDVVRVTKLSGWQQDILAARRVAKL